MSDILSRLTAEQYREHLSSLEGVADWRRLLVPLCRIDEATTLTTPCKIRELARTLYMIMNQLYSVVERTGGAGAVGLDAAVDRLLTGLALSMLQPEFLFVDARHILIPLLTGHLDLGELGPAKNARLSCCRKILKSLVLWAFAPSLDSPAERGPGVPAEMRAHSSFAARKCSDELLDAAIADCGRMSPTPDLKGGDPMIWLVRRALPFLWFQHASRTTVRSKGEDHAGVIRFIEKALAASAQGHDSSSSGALMMTEETRTEEIVRGSADMVFAHYMLAEKYVTTSEALFHSDLDRATLLAKKAIEHLKHFERTAPECHWHAPHVKMKLVHRILPLAAGQPWMIDAAAVRLCVTAFPNAVREVEEMYAQGKRAERIVRSWSPPESASWKEIYLKEAKQLVEQLAQFCSSEDKDNGHKTTPMSVPDTVSKCANAACPRSKDAARAPLKLSACARCRRVKYCSNSCQLLDWKARHKKECATVTSAAAQPGIAGGKHGCQEAWAQPLSQKKNAANGTTKSK